jgi:hypothetical protein
VTRSKRPSVTNPAKPADQYALPNERIIEFYDEAVQAGGLISLMRIEGNDGRYTMRVSVYQYDGDLIEVRS